jgi:hypothetical protein
MVIYEFLPLMFLIYHSFFEKANERHQKVISYNAKEFLPSNIILLFICRKNETLKVCQMVNSFPTI